MKTKDIAERLTALCRKGKFEDAQKKLFAKNAVSIEPEAMPGFAKKTKGLPAIVRKGHKFMAGLDAVHSIKVSKPIVAGNSFVCAMDLDVTMKGKGRTDISELCLYEVKNGKIISEQFHW